MTIGRLRRIGSAAVIAGWLAAVAPAPVLAQPKPAVDCQTASPYFDLTFPGGSAADLLREIRAAYPCANIVVTGDADDYPVPAMELRQVTVGAVLGLAEGGEDVGGGVHVSMDVKSIEIEGELDKAYRVRVYTQDFGMSGPSPAPVASVRAIGPILDQGLTAADVLGAVSAALESYEAKATISFHEPTRLLIVRGTKPQLEVVASVLGELASATSQSREAEEARAVRLIEQRAEVAEAEITLEFFHKRVELARAKLAMAARAAEDDPMATNLQQQRLDAEMRLAEAQRDLLHAQSGLEEQRARLRLLEAGSGGGGGNP